MGITWNKIKNSMTDSVKNLSEKTGKMTQIGRFKIEMIALKRDIEKSFIELGGRVYHGLEEKHDDIILEDLRIKKLVKDIKALELKLRSLEKKVEQVRDHKIEIQGEGTN